MMTATRQRFRRGLILVSFLFFPITMFYFSPYLIIAGAAKGVVAGSFIAFSLMFMSAIVLGRGFCGWICPGAGLQEACLLARERRTKTGKLDWIKYGIWVPWLGGITAAAAAAGGLRHIDPLFGTWQGISIAEPGNYVTYYFFLALIVVLALTAGRRAFCHYVCWMAPFMVLGRKLGEAARLPALRIRVNTAACKECGSCVQACPMSLEVTGMVRSGSMENAECILCGTCVDTCPRGVLRYGFGRRSGRTCGLE